MGAVKKVEFKKDDVIFREGDQPDSAYLVQSGRIAIVKQKGAGEITLAELGPGEMLGEMSLFDQKPRSAGAKSMTDNTVVVNLPLAALRNQLKSAPKWVETVFKTINEHLRDANKRIKNLEQIQNDDEKVFDVYTVNRLLAILVLVAEKFGAKSPDGVVVPAGTLRRYTIQIFQQPTNKMAKLTEVLTELGHMKTEKLEAGKTRLTLLSPDLLTELVDYYNEYVMTEEEKRVTIEARHLPALKALEYYAKKAGGKEGTEVPVPLNEIQNDSMKLLGEFIKIEDFDPIIEKELCGEKIMSGETITCGVDLAKIAPLIKYWTVIFALEKVRK